ncbi:MAG: VCBS repeat-containing protein [Deltaproteobacteria bacterium]|nr:VCBS repeat-containing protein [Deltaproteobacteria bacterium]
MVRAVVALGVIGLAAAPARANDATDDYFTRLQAAVQQSLDQVLAARPPVLVPPVPVKLTWKAVRLGSLDLNAPLVALGASDLDHDGKAELYAVTTRDVVAISVAGKKVSELGRAGFAGTPAVPASRDPVGTIVFENRELVASTSAWDNELRLRWQNGTLSGSAPGKSANGVVVCPGERLVRMPGRNHFGDLAQPIYAVRCAELVDPMGAPIRVRAALIGSKLEINVERCGQGTAGKCLPVARYDLKDYGSAFEVADVDRDGKPEIIVSGAGAPGDPDVIKVFTLGGNEKKGLYRKTFNGGVAGIAVADGDGDGVPEVIAAVRLAGATRVDLWRLD